MATLVIRKLDGRIKSRLLAREAIRRRFAPFGGVELPVIERACLVGKSALP